MPNSFTISADGHIKSKEKYMRPITVEAEIKATGAESDCLAMNLFPGSEDLMSEIGFVIGFKQGKSLH